MLNRLRLGTKIGVGFTLGIAIFAIIAAVAYRGINRLVDSSKWENHTYEVLSQLSELTTQLVNAETDQRGYLITGNPEYLEPYNTATIAIDQKVKELRRLASDNLSQQRRLDQLEPLLSDRLRVMQRNIDVRQNQGFAAAQKALQTNEGKRLMDQIRQLVAALKQEEQELLKQRSGSVEQATRQTLDTVAYGVPLYTILLVLIGFVLTRNISRPLRQVSEVADRIADGDLSADLPTSDRQDEIGTLSRTFNEMVASLRETTQLREEQNWLKSNLADFTQMLQGQRDQAAVAKQILSKLAPLVEAQQGVFYLLDADVDPPVLKLLSSYAYQERKHLSHEFRLGEGLVGQCALEQQRILLTNAPSDYIRISSGLGNAAPLNIVVLPILFETQVTGVIELASLQRFTDLHLALLEQVTAGIGVVLSTIAANTRTNQLLQSSQALTEELQHQQEELQESNQRLEEQAEELQTSEVQLKEQQEELQQTNEELQQLNEELEEKAEMLSVQNREVERKNQEIEQARQAIEDKAEQLALSSKYKSEFLANMSHELRTPLNSLLILARLLSENGEGNLTGKQIEYSHTIYSAGTDLLELINDILDLAKIESGMMSVKLESMLFSELRTFLERTFGQVAQDRGLAFQIELDSQLPAAIVTDTKRLQQILKNLLANAFKFTEQGGVTLSIAPTIKTSILKQTTTPMIAFSVIDTGIGIPPDKQKIIFEAFQQVDGTTSRKYGGTGLGLSISRELAQLLNGSIELTSQPEQGSTFTLYLPQETSAASRDPEPQQSTPVLSSSVPTLQRDTALIPLPPPALLLNEMNDDRDQIQPGDRVMLIIEDDVNFVRILMDMARKQGFKVLAALRSRTGLAMAQERIPDAIMLDIRLPDMDGWTVLDRLKHNSTTRHIPVHILSVDEGQQRGLQLGAISYLQKPVSPEALAQALTGIKEYIERQVKNLLVIEDDVIQAQSIRELIGNGDVQTTIVGSGAQALMSLRTNHFDCVVLDLGLPDMSGLELIEQIKQDPTLSKLPIIVYTGKDLSRQEETQLKRLAETIIVKDVRSPERLLDETALFLHRIQANLPQPKQQMLEQLHQTDPVLADKKVLIVDDDVRNIFALTSLLERYQMAVLYAENGRDGISVLENHPDIDAILMDVMMPEMDGYETTRAIRQREQFRTLPIVALTAKAMQGDREKCLEAGASDYIAKPVDTEQLLSLLRVWLYH